MITPLLENFNFSFIAIPVWRLEPLEPVPAADAAPLTPAADRELATATDALTAPAAPGVRLVLKYEYHPPTHWYPFVNPAWDHFADNDDDEIRERADRLQSERRQAEQSDLAQPDITRPAPSHADLANETAAPAAPADAQRIRP